MPDGKKEFTLEDILQEERFRREFEEHPVVVGSTESIPTPPLEELIPEETREELPEEIPAEPVGEDTADLNAFATGQFARTAWDEEQSVLSSAMEEPAEKQPKGKKKKKKRGLFGRKKVPAFDEGEDLYYGLQLKPIDEYSRGIDATGEFTLEEDSYKALFDDSKKALDDEVEANFQRLQKERRRRVAEAVQTAGVDEEEIANEFGVVAPMPVTAAADVTGELDVEALTDLQKAMVETAQDQNLEMKLNVFNDTIELKAVTEEPVISDETAERILASDEPVLREPVVVFDETEEPVSAAWQAPSDEVQIVFEDISSDSGWDPPVKAAEPAPAAETTESVKESTPAAEKAVPAEEKRPADIPQKEAVLAEEQAEEPAAQKPAVRQEPPAREVREIPVVEEHHRYRAHTVPNHVINVDVLQGALLSESEEIRQAEEEDEGRRFQRRHRAVRQADVYAGEEPPENPEESINDYTGPADAKSIAAGLKADMHKMTLRMLITGVCTVLLVLNNLILGSRLDHAPDGGTAAIVYVLLTILFTGAAIGVCARTVVSGLRALFDFDANADSAAAVAAAAVGLQSVVALFFRSDLAAGKVHLYAVVLTAILFLNAAGKLTMIRRIHGNFRFVTSREDKYTVKTYDDYNNALRMTRDAVAERPLIAYQNKAGFLRRFLELSYKPDISESTTQTLAPLGLICSLVVCIACLLISRSVPAALSALAAACCACVAVGNMLAVNLPVSRLSKTARRAGAMTVGYEAVEQLGGVNAVLIDAGDIFPRGTVVLDTIKVTGSRSSGEEAIINASALMQQVGGPMLAVFDQVVSEIDDDLPEVEAFSYEPGSGVVGRVGGRQIYIGSRSLLINHRIDVLTREEEIQLSSGNRQVVYIAMDESVAAILTLTYSADRRCARELQRMENSGISVILRTTDPNVTTQLIARLFGVDVASVSVIDGELGDTARELTAEETPRADAVAATKGRAESLMSLIAACVDTKRSLTTVVAVQIAAVILGFVLVAFLACFGAMGRLSAALLFIFEALCLIVVLGLPKLRR